jgi:hypothetical protein
MRDGIPEAKSCLADLRQLQRKQATLRAKLGPICHEFAEAKKRFDDANDEIAGLADQIATLADGVVANIGYDVDGLDGILDVAERQFAEATT